jgi:hypothetical protein
VLILIDLKGSNALDLTVPLILQVTTDNGIR